MNPELLAEIHAKSFITPRPWSALEFDELLIKDSIFLISEKRSFLLGMLVGWIVAVVANMVVITLDFARFIE